MKIVSLQYLRGFAALLVVVAHNSFLLGEGWTGHIPGALGVDVFFIISGFIMTLITYQSPERPISFFIRRLFRLWPALFVVWLVSYLFVYPKADFDQRVCSLYFCLQDYSAEGPSFGFSPLGPPWTLTYEVMFYLIFTLSMSISYLYRSAVCALFFMASSIVFQLYYNGRFDFSAQSALDSITVHVWQVWIKLIANTITVEFIAGMMLAELMLANKLPVLTRSGRRLIQMTLSLAVISACIIGPQVFGMSGGFWLALVIVVSTVMLSYHSEAAGSGVLIFLGNISYSLYLVHYALIVFLGRFIPDNASTIDKAGLFVLSITVSIGVAFVMFNWIETPFIRVGKKVASVLSPRQK
ncbi:acyltransferase [Pseudomonas syringae]|uniref:acyltransferase family protein n=1 Tax=Pseudomonas syringae TaxID=317 RepID=UPI00215A86F7|nr:acyltransferase [Pseudomonas syringae]MCR8717638.1 acyltransferase [Pseudomonas syringae]